MTFDTFFKNPKIINNSFEETADLIYSLTLKHCSEKNIEWISQFSFIGSEKEFCIKFIEDKVEKNMAISSNI